MANYAVANTTSIGGGGVQQAIATTYKSMVVTAASTLGTGLYPALRRGKVYDILVGTNGTPADNYMEFDVVRAIYASSTAITTGTVGMVSSLSSNFALDVADPNFGGAASINSSVETYLTTPTEIWYVGINQRASYRWVAAPGSELVYPAISSGSGANALAVRARSGAYTGTATTTVLVTEQ